MIGGAVIATRAPDTELAGAQLEAVMWRWRVGLALEGSHQAGLDTSVTTLGASVRLLLHHELTPSLLDPQEQVELGFELHGIVERAWWNDNVGHEPISYGAGLVVRLRGDTDFTNIVAESRLFVRAMWSRHDAMDSLARTTMPQAERGALIVVGIGALFGGAQPAHARQFRRRELDSLILPGN